MGFWQASTSRGQIRALLGEAMLDSSFSIIPSLYLTKPYTGRTIHPFTHPSITPLPSRRLGHLPELSIGQFERCCWFSSWCLILWILGSHHHCSPYHYPFHPTRTASMSKARNPLPYAILTMSSVWYLSALDGPSRLLVEKRKEEKKTRWHKNHNLTPSIPAPSSAPAVPSPPTPGSPQIALWCCP